jgi:hypothetical protein
VLSDFFNISNENLSAIFVGIFMALSVFSVSVVNVLFIKLAEILKRYFAG